MVPCSVLVLSVVYTFPVSLVSEMFRRKPVPKKSNQSRNLRIFNFIMTQLRKLLSKRGTKIYPKEVVVVVVVVVVVAAAVVVVAVVVVAVSEVVVVLVRAF